MAVRFEIPPSVPYDCVCCGDGCRSFEILLGPGEEETIEGLDWASVGRPDLGGQTAGAPIQVPGLGARRRIMRKADKSCVYLDDDNLCAIHKHFGMEKKPLLCRLYPFGFYALGDRVAVDVAYSCRAVRNEQGEEVTEARLPEWIARLDDAAQIRDTRKHRLKAGVQAPGETLWAIEHTLVRFLQSEEHSFPDRVRLCLQFLRLATTGAKPAAPSATLFREAIAEGLPKQLPKLLPITALDPTQRVAFLQWAFLSLNPPPYEVHRLSPTERQALEAERFAFAREFQEGRGGVRIANENLAGVTPANVMGVSVEDLLAGEGGRLLTKYLIAKVMGQRFLVSSAQEEEPLVEGAWQLLLQAPIALWGAKALAAADGASEARIEHLRPVLRPLDLTVGQVAIGQMPKEQKETYRFLFEETDWILASLQAIRQGTL